MKKRLSLPGLEGPDRSASLLARQPKSDDSSEERQIIAYLRSGYVVATSPGAISDILSDEKKIIGAGHVLSDATWWWPDYLVYYVETYHFKLPEEFIAHGRANGWKVPQPRTKSRLASTRSRKKASHR